MRDYAKVAPQFWTGETGRMLRTLGPQAQVTALYLLTCPSANMIGLYYLPIPTLCHETGSPSEGALKALRSLSEGSFAHYDEVSEHVFVPEMAKYQIGETLSRRDNRHKALVKELENWRKSRFFNDFLSRYRGPFELEEAFGVEPTPSPSEAPSKPLRSQKQEQEQKKEQERAGGSSPPGTAGGLELTPSKPKAKVVNGQEHTMATFFARCKESGEDPIPSDDAVHVYAEKAKIPHEFVLLAWKVFRAKYENNAKRYKNWRLAFLNYVKEAGYGLWTVDLSTKQYLLTGKGRQAQIVHGSGK